MNPSESRVTQYSPMVNEPDDHGESIPETEQQPSVPSVAELRAAHKKKLMRNTAVALGAVLVVGLFGGVLGALLVPHKTPPIEPTTTTTPATTTTTTTKPTTPPTTQTPFPPPTRHPLPPHPETLPAISLLYQMGMDPNFTEVICARADPPVFKYNVIVVGHTFTSQGGDEKKIAKTTAAMVANEALFNIRYPSMPQPKSVCKVI